MLPERLSAGLASLLQAQERPAVSVVWTLRGGDGAVEDVWFGRTIVRWASADSACSVQNCVLACRVCAPLQLLATQGCRCVAP